jgi:WD40 repeat protein
VADAARTAQLSLGGEVYKLVPSGESFFTSSAEKKVRQYNAKDQKQIREYPAAADWLLSAAAHPATKRVAGGAFDGQVTVWNTEDGKQVTTFTAAPGYAPAK